MDLCLIKRILSSIETLPLVDQWFPREMCLKIIVTESRRRRIVPFG